MDKQEKQWRQAADIILLMRKQTRTEDKIKGLYEAAHLLTLICDEEKDLAGCCFNKGSRIQYLKKAQCFCDVALSYNKTLDSESPENRPEAIYYHRAIVKARLAKEYPAKSTIACNTYSSGEDRDVLVSTRLDRGAQP